MLQPRIRRVRQASQARTQVRVSESFGGLLDLYAVLFEELLRIGGFAVELNFQVKVTPADDACCAYICDDGSAGHCVAGLHFEAGWRDVAVDGFDALAVVDDDPVSEGSRVANERHLTAGCCFDRCATRVAEVDSFVEVLEQPAPLQISPRGP